MHSFEHILNGGENVSRRITHVILIVETIRPLCIHDHGADCPPSRCNGCHPRPPRRSQGHPRTCNPVSCTGVAVTHRESRQGWQTSPETERVCAGGEWCECQTELTWRWQCGTDAKTLQCLVTETPKRKGETDTLVFSFY